jgi:hypothetical protein
MCSPDVRCCTDACRRPRIRLELARLDVFAEQHLERDRVIGTAVETAVLPFIRKSLE